MNRRFFLLAAPAIVAAPSLMKVSALAMPPPLSAVNYGAMEITSEMLAKSIARYMETYVRPQIIRLSAGMDLAIHGTIYGTK